MGTNLNVAGISRAGGLGTYTYGVINNGGDSVNRSIIQMQPNGVNQARNLHSQTNYVFGCACQIPVGKILVSVKLPNNQNVGILGISMV